MSKFMRAFGICVLIVLIPLAGFAGGVGLLRVIESIGVESPLRDGDFRAVTQAVGSPVVLLSTSTCPWCEKTRLWLNERAIPYRDCVVDEDAFAAELLERVGGKSVPQLLNAQSVASGYDPELFVRIVQEAPSQTADVQRCSAPAIVTPASTAQATSVSSSDDGTHGL